MIKECKVLLNNEAVTVVKYDDVWIQFPSIHKNKNTIFVNCEGNKYSIVDKNHKTEDTQTAKVVSKKKSANKKTTIDESAKENEKDICDTQDT